MINLLQFTDLEAFLKGGVQDRARRSDNNENTPMLMFICVSRILKSVIVWWLALDFNG